MTVQHAKVERKLDSLMSKAKEYAKDSHDIHTQVGAVLIDPVSGAILASGFNGFVRGAPDDKLPTTRPEKYEYMQHAEVNAIYNSAWHGVATVGLIAICTLSPCSNCMRALWQSGVSTIYFDEEYRDFHKHIKMGDLEVKVSKIGKYTKVKLSRKSP